MNRYIPFLITLIYLTPVFYTSAATTEPSSWIRTYICDRNGTLNINNRDLQVLLNLLYLSFDRSRITLEASEDGIRALRVPWQAFQNIVQLRRNPSKYTPYLLDKNRYIDDTNLLYDLQSEHHRIGKTYSMATETILHGTLVTDDQLKLGIQVLREDARKVISEALTNVQEYLDVIINMNSKKESSQEIPFEARHAYLLQKNFSLGDYIWSLMPNMALNSFVKADDLTISISEDWWKALYQLLIISNIIWKSIEQARAQLYLTYYQAVYTVAKDQGIDMQTMTLMFDKQGMIVSTEQTVPLPDPIKLQVPHKNYVFPAQ